MVKCMNKIKELIDRQLGELPEVKNSNGSFNYSLYQKYIKELPLYFKSNQVYLPSASYEIWCELYIKEQEKRELLEVVIEAMSDNLLSCRCDDLDCIDLKQVKLIEKHLKMGWNEIIDFLED